MGYVSMAHDAARRVAIWHRALPLLLLAAGIGAYCNSFAVPFLFDDTHTIRDNVRIRHLWPLWNVMAGTTRPIVQLSFGINYALGGLGVWGYHAGNLLIHLLAALTLFGLVRRTFLTQRLRTRYGSAAFGLSLVVAVLWVVHPLQTQAVTYIAQRAESLMGLCYLLTLYGFIRGVNSPLSRIWYAAAVLACAVGMASKPIMVTAPVMVLLYDRLFLSGSVQAAWRRRRGFYLSLAATWILLAGLLLSVPEEYAAGAGFTFKDITALEYTASQPGVILHYLRLALWPKPLVFDYAWPVARTLWAIVAPSIVLAGLLLLTLWALRRRRAVGFLGAWFFLILSPTSSVIPISDLAFEYRMYLPLAAIIALVVVSGYEFLMRLSSLRVRMRQCLTAGLLSSLVFILGMLTIQRNLGYASEEALWRDTVAKRPTNPRAHNNLGAILRLNGRLEEALPHLTLALRLAPNYAEAHNNLGYTFYAQGRFEEGAIHLTEALRLKPDYAEAHNNLGMTLVKLGKLEEAIVHFSKALQLKPDYAKAHNNMGAALWFEGRLEEAIAEFSKALRLAPDYAEARSNLEAALAQQKNRTK